MKPGDTVGAYRIITAIGVGASSTVYRAVRTADEHQVAIKVLADNHSILVESRQRFSDETKLLASVQHPAVATIYEIGETATGQPYMVMELANRGDLRGRVAHLHEQGGSLRINDIHAVATHLHQALGVLHDLEVVHQDISPANILIRCDQPGSRPPMTTEVGLLDPTERLLTTDLGFAKRLQDGSDSARGRGTHGFASPEQRDRLSVVDHRSDLFGATALINWLADALPPEVALPEEFKEFLEKGMAANPEDRHTSADEWFKSFETSVQSKATDPIAPTAPWLVAASKAGAVAAAAIVAIGALGWWLFADRSSSEVAAPVGTTTTDEPSTSTTSTSTTSTNPAPPTTRDPLRNAPRAQLSSPVNNQLIDGDLRVEGTATASEGVACVLLVIRDNNELTFWNTSKSAFSRTYEPAVVGVSDPGSTEVSWSFFLSDAQIPPGTYQIRAWAVASDGGNGSVDPVSDIRVFTVE